MLKSKHCKTSVFTFWNSFRLFSRSLIFEVVSYEYGIANTGVYSSNLIYSNRWKLPLHRWWVNSSPRNRGQLRMGSLLNALPYKLFITTFHPVLTLLYTCPDPRLSRRSSLARAAHYIECTGRKRALRIIPRDACYRVIPRLYCIRFVPWGRRCTVLPCSR